MADATRHTTYNRRLYTTHSAECLKRVAPEALPNKPSSNVGAWHYLPRSLCALDLHLVSGLRFGVWGFRVWGLVFGGIWCLGLGSGVWCLGFGVWGSGFWCWGFGNWMCGLGFGVLGFGVWSFGFQVLGSRVWGLGFRVWGLGFEVWGLGFGVWGVGLGV